MMRSRSVWFLFFFCWREMVFFFLDSQPKGSFHISSTFLSEPSWRRETSRPQIQVHNLLTRIFMIWNSFFFFFVEGFPDTACLLFLAAKNSSYKNLGGSQTFVLDTNIHDTPVRYRRLKMVKFPRVLAWSRRKHNFRKTVTKIEKWENTTFVGC